MCTKFTLKGKPSFLSSLPGCILSTDKSEHSEQTPARKDNSTNGGQSPLGQVSIWSPLPYLLHSSPGTIWPTMWCSIMALSWETLSTLKGNLIQFWMMEINDHYLMNDWNQRPLSHELLKSTTIILQPSLQDPQPVGIDAHSRRCCWIWNRGEHQQLKHFNFQSGF